MSWSAVAVRRILVNEMYAGIMVQGKTETINYKEKKAAARPKEEWVRVSDNRVYIPPVSARIQRTRSNDIFASK